jgi:hypothetical protein
MTTSQIATLSPWKCAGFTATEDRDLFVRSLSDFKSPGAGPIEVEPIDGGAAGCWFRADERMMGRIEHRVSDLKGWLVPAERPSE